MSKQFYITTAIDYANGSPHLGHAYEKILTDTIARYRRLIGDEVFFLTGLDEHGQKVQQTAAKRGVDPQALCDEVAVVFQDMCKRLNITHNDYIRTTEERHKKVVRDLLQKLHDSGDIYKAEFKGFYSPRAEQFLKEKDRVDGKWPEEYGEVIEISETNYFFRLAKYKDWLVEYLNENQDFIFPRFRLKQVLEFLKEPINDLCISRPKERLSWGISLPFDENYVTYVWFDALVNYISAVGYGTPDFEKCWPADYHVIGKDIMLPPHSVYWPIMLKALGIPIPKHLLVHGWWLQSGEKMSKSLGNYINPLDLLDIYGTDAFRYFVMREMNVGQDSDFSVELFKIRYTSDLGNDLGNLVSRLLNMGSRYCEGGKLPAPEIDEEPEKELRALWDQKRDETLSFYGDFQFHQGLDRTFQFIKAINRYAEIRAPWKLAKSEDTVDQQKLRTSLFYMGEGLRLGSILLAAVMPDIANRIQGLLGQGEIKTWKSGLDWGNVLVGASLGEKTILFPRPDQE